MHGPLIPYSVEGLDSEEDKYENFPLFFAFFGQVSPGGLVFQGVFALLDYTPVNH